jgi:dUTP pyrophosphatase
MQLRKRKLLMNRIAQFKKVSYKQWRKDSKGIMQYLKFLSTEKAKEIYDNYIILPKRATVGSAGYDFISITGAQIAPNETVLIPSGIRVKIDEGWVLKLYPRSGLGFKYRLQLDNSVGIIDSDYYYSDNEGHIFFKMTNHSDKLIQIEPGGAYAQGIFEQFGITKDDMAEGVRNGGFGSTTI